MKFELTRKPGTVLSCRPRAQKTPTKDIYQRVDAYYSQKAKTWNCAHIIDFLPKHVRGVQGEVSVATTSRDKIITDMERDESDEPDLLKALKDSGIWIHSYINEYEVSKLLGYLGFREWLGEMVRKSEQNRYKIWTLKEVYKHTCQWLAGDSDMIDIQRGKLLVKLESLINRSKNLPQLEDKFLKDDRDTCYIPFRNTLIKITKDGPECLSYSDIQGNVWKHNIIDHDYTPLSELDGDWWKFLNRTCSERGEGGPVDGSFEEDRFEALLCAIGYNIHRYKNPSRPALTIFSDKDRGRRDDGRTGKSIITKSIKHMNRQEKYIDGRSISPDNRFNFSDVTASTDVINIDDLKCKVYKLEKLYSLVTGDMTLEPKGLPPFTIPYEHAPKFLISTNDISPIGTNPSDLDRRMDMQLKHYYSNSYKPVRDFHKDFWGDRWTDEDWNQFYHVQIYAVQKSLQHNVAIYGLPEYTNTIIDDSIRHEISEKLIDVFEAKLKDMIEAGGEIKLTNAELSTWVDDMGVKDIKSKLVKYHQLKLEDKYTIDCEKPFKIPSETKSCRGVILSPKQQSLSAPVSPSRP